MVLAVKARRDLGPGRGLRTKACMCVMLGTTGCRVIPAGSCNIVFHQTTALQPRLAHCLQGFLYCES